MIFLGDATILAEICNSITMNFMFRRIKDWYTAQNDTVKAFVWIGLICVVGIIIRWDAVVAGVTKGFRFYSGK